MQQKYFEAKAFENSVSQTTKNAQGRTFQTPNTSPRTSAFGRVLTFNEFLANIMFLNCNSILYMEVVCC